MDDISSNAERMSNPVQYQHPTCVHRLTVIDRAKADSELHAKWVAAQDIGSFHDMLSAETEDGKFSILAQLLSQDLERMIKRPPLVPAPRPIS